MNETETFAATRGPSNRARWRWPTASLRAYMAAIIVLATVPLAGLTSWMIFQEGQASRKQFESGLQRAAASFALTVEREVASSIDALTILSYSSQVRGDDVPGFFQALIELPRRRSTWTAAYLIDLDGHVLFSTARSADPAGTATASPAGGSASDDSVSAQISSLAGGPAFRQVKNSLRPAVSDMVVDSRGGSTIGVQVPVIVDGNLRYVLGATVDSSSWRGLLASASLPSDSRVLLVDGGGKVIAATNSSARSSDAAAAAPATPPTQISDAARAGLYSLQGRVQKAVLFDSDPSYTAWRAVAGTQWTIGMDVELASLDDAYSTSLLTAVAAGLLSLGAGLAMALMLARHVTRPLRQLALGGPAAVPGAVEVREIELLREALRSAEAHRAHAREQMAADMAERDALAAREHAARQEAETANRVKDEFMAMLSHELRNPLGAISSAAELLNRIGMKEMPAQNAVRVIGRQTRHLAHLMDDLLDVARVITGKIMLSRGPLNLAAVVQRLMATLEMTGATRDHRVTVHVEDCWINADVTRIEQIVNNLVTNALKYTPSGGKVDVSVRAEADSAVFEVRDNGVGIAPSLLPRLFDLFVQGDRALDRRHGGLGVGLTLVRRLVELHGGNVGVTSPDVGSAFTVRLPCVPAPADEHASLPAPVATVSSNGRRVLVVEDNEDALQVMRALLELAGHEVVTACDGTSGLQLLIESKCEVALIDIGLPGLTGLEVAERARAAGVKSLLIALTGYGQPKDVERTRAAGFDAHLVKPIDPRSLELLFGEKAPREHDLPL
ncbi:hypothetical protein BH09PSE5_BH09PSE5_19210 [soil metagenome]